MLRLRQVEASAWSILAICDERGACQVQEFMHRLETDSPGDFDQITAQLRRTAVSGPPQNDRKSRPLADKLFEFKTRRGIRIPYFYDEGRVIICTEAMRKPKKAELRAVIKRAQAQRTRYFEAKRNQAVVIIQEDA